jgi:S-DNA-T family DNA segregation ATPase FtsK/SpoIIIE
MAELVDRSAPGKKPAQALGVLLIALGVFLGLSLFSNSAQDFPNSTRALAQTSNWGGRSGAFFAYLALAGVGYAAYALPLLALVWGWNRLLQHPLSAAVHRSLGVLGMGLAFSMGAGLPGYSAQTAFRLGGWLGLETSTSILIPYGGRIGSAVLLGAVFLAAMVLTTDAVFRFGWQGLCYGARLVQQGMPWNGSQPVQERARPQEDRADARATVAEETRPFLESLPAVENEEPGVPLIPEPVETEPVFERTVLVSPRQAEELLAPKKAEVRVGSPKPAGAGPSVLRRRSGNGRYRMPDLDLLTPVPADHGGIDRAQLLENARSLEEALRDFDVAGRVVEVSPGPVVTRYEVEPAAGVKVNRIVILADDLARVMSANGIRIQAPVPGKSVVGVEIANQQRQTVYLREILESRAFNKAESKLSLALGKTITGEAYVADLTRMPHLLVAGATGAGKSVCINCLISSLLFKATPEEVRLLMVDPKVVELTMYNGIPHLLAPVITDPKKASEALRWAVLEMEVRYQKLARLGVRHLVDYNRKVVQVEPDRPMPYIVLVIDEFADLMLTAPADVETSLMSLAQKSRAVGIHLILATQRPSVNVITGVIKANFPSRIAFQVASKTDSRTILDMNGAERLLGRGDMLFLPGGQGEPQRVHGAYVSSEETERLVESIKGSGYQPEEVAIFPEHADIRADRQDRDELFDESVRLVVEYQQASTSFLQRRMKVGYSRAARLMDELESAGIVGPADGAKPREILVTGDGGTGQPSAGDWSAQR